MTEEERYKMGDNGKKYVLKNFTYKKLAQDYMELF
jgi:hypothetical protein